jgi:hypothetical protein
MKATRIYTGEDNRSHFEDLDIPLERAAYGSESKLIPSLGVIFRENRVGDSLNFHNPARRQFVITISGVGELECGDGSRRRFRPGDILLADDLTGEGHITREIEGPRRAIFIPLSEDLDVGGWRIKQLM